MAHWAEIDENNIVIRLLVCDNNDPNGDEGQNTEYDQGRNNELISHLSCQHTVHFPGPMQ